MLLVDSGVWIAVFNETEDHSIEVTDFAKWFDNQNQYAIIRTNLILAEILNHRQRKTNLMRMRKNCALNAQ